jgi:hypothetical protein
MNPGLALRVDQMTSTILGTTPITLHMVIPRARVASIGRRQVVAAIGALLFAGSVVNPVLADTEQGHTGTVGFHQLRDNSTYGASLCGYTGTGSPPSGYSYEGELDTLAVRPPKVRAISGSQKVGWRFTVQRRSEDELSAMWFSWVDRYRSPIQRKVTNSTTNAAFTWMDVDVNVPTSSFEATPRYQYRVLVKMFWFRADGSIQGTATHRVDWYTSWYDNWPSEDGYKTSVKSRPCLAWVGVLSETP